MQMKMPGGFSIKKKVFRIRGGSASDFGFMYGGTSTYKSERSYSSASDSTNSMSSCSDAESPKSTSPTPTATASSAASTITNSTGSGLSKSDSVGSSSSSRSNPQVHPIASMQGPYNESIRFPKVDVENAYNPKGYDLKYHPLIKVYAQIAFGIHLLHKRISKSDLEVVNILQHHVDDVNKFLNKSTSNFDYFTSDIEERHKNLKTAIDNSSVFERMLATDLSFRETTIEGNRKVDTVIKKRNATLEKSLRDIYEGMRGLNELSKYMNTLKKGWKNTGLAQTYGIMMSNLEVWARCFETLRKAGVKLALGIEKLKYVNAQVDKKVKKASKHGVRARKAIGSSPSPDCKRTLKHAKSMPAIPKRTSSLRIRESALAPLGLTSMLFEDSEVDLNVPTRSPKPPLRLKCSNLEGLTTPPPAPLGKTTFFNMDESDNDDQDHDSPVTVTCLTPRPLHNPNHWKPLPPTPVTPPPDALLDSFPEPGKRLEIPEMKLKSADDEDGASPLTIELCLEESLDDNTSTFQLRPIYGEHGLSHSRSCSPLPVIQPLTIRSSSVAA